MPGKILIFSNCAPSPTTGSGLVVLNFIRCIENKHIITSVRTPDNSPFLSSVHPRFISLRLSVAWLIYLLRQLLRNRVDVKHIVVFGGEAWLFLFVFSGFIRARGIKVIHYTNGPEFKYRPHFRKEGLFSRLLTHCMKYAFTLSDEIITVSKTDAEWLKIRLGPKPIFTLNPCIDNIFFAGGESPEENLEAITRFVFCGRWTLEKGKDVVVGFIEQLTLAGISFEFHLAGVEDLKLVKSDLGGLYGDHIHIHPFITDKEKLRNLYRSCNYLIFPSRGESFGLVLIEAMSSGCIVLSAKVGVLGSVDQDIYLQCETDKNSFFQQFMMIRQDIQKQKAIREKALQFSRQFSFENYCNKLHDLIG